MSIKKHCITVILVLFCAGLSHSQEIYTESAFDLRDDVVMAYSPDSDVAFADSALIESFAPLAKQSRSAHTTEWQRHTYLKTNLLGLGAAIANLSFEIDLTKHLSFALPVYYSSWDYFTSALKFRTFTVQPELRFWFSRKNDGLFIGAHYTLAYYNLAFNGKYRYQDRNGNTPALGGGMSIGYRFPISRSGRWKMELSVGGGYYPLEYDLFQNVPNGDYSHYEKRKYLGIDQATLSIAYMLNRNKRSK